MKRKPEGDEDWLIDGWIELHLCWMTKGKILVIVVLERWQFVSQQTLREHLHWHLKIDSKAMTKLGEREVEWDVSTRWIGHFGKTSSSTFRVLFQVRLFFRRQRFAQFSQGVENFSLLTRTFCSIQFPDFRISFDLEKCYLTERYEQWSYFSQTVTQLNWLLFGKETNDFGRVKCFTDGALDGLYGKRKSVRTRI